MLPFRRARKKPSAQVVADVPVIFVAFDVPTPELRDQALSVMLDEGVLGLASGDQAIRFRPALSLTLDEAGEGLASGRIRLAFHAMKVPSSTTAVSPRVPAAASKPEEMKRSAVSTTPCSGSA